MTKETMQLGVRGVVSIQDDLGNTILNKQNAIHPQNMARIIARALANEPNSSIYKLALGRGGTFIDATGEVSYRRANDGLTPDNQMWQSTLYDETYSLIVDEDINPANSVRSFRDPTKQVTQVVVTCVLARVLPGLETQLSTSLLPSSINGAFVFDELGLFTAGLPRLSTQGYQDVAWTTPKFSTDFVELAPTSTYHFDICIDPVDVNAKVYTRVNIVVPPGVAGTLPYGDFVGLLNKALPMGVVAQISQPGINTDGRLRFISTLPGNQSAVYIKAINPTDPLYATWLFKALTETLQSTQTRISPTLMASVPGKQAGQEEETAIQSERMLTHLIFSPLQKDASREWTITYTLTVNVLQSDPIT